MNQALSIKACLKIRHFQKRRKILENHGLELHGNGMTYGIYDPVKQEYIKKLRYFTITAALKN